MIKLPQLLPLGFGLLAGTVDLPGNIVYAAANFSDGMQGWEPNSPWVTETADGIGVNNPYLQMIIGEYGNRGSRLITFNPLQPWTGNLLSEGVHRLSLDLRNWSEQDPVYLRLVIGNRANPQQPGGTWWISKTPVLVNPLSDWQAVSIDISEGTMQRVGNLMGELGTDSWESTFANVQGFRILSSTLGFSAIGDEFFGTVGMDNITLYTTVPEPRHTTVILLCVAALASLTWHRRHRVPGVRPGRKRDAFRAR